MKISLYSLCFLTLLVVFAPPALSQQEPEIRKSRENQSHPYVGIWGIKDGHVLGELSL
tara:strand:+ start:2198 stop:2371 length:174 start_codon:yes stop_codon:yes gene_type:complete